MRILLASSFLLFEKSRFGGAKRLYNIALGLSKEHEVSVVCFDGCSEAINWDGTHSFERFLFIPSPAPQTGLRLTHVLNHTDRLRKHKNAIRKFFDTSSFDYAILGYSLAPNFLHIPEVAAIPHIAYIEGDLVIWQADQNRRKASGLLRLLKEIRYLQIRRYYRSFLKSVDVFFLSTQTEMQEVSSRFPATRVRQLPYGFEPGKPPDFHPPLTRNIAGFIGNFGHKPNLDALNWYLDNVHPILCLRHPEYKLHIAGMGAPQELRTRVEGDSQAVLVGAVDNVESFYEGISFLVNPIISGRGIRTKVLEAASYSRPVVSTNLGADGAEAMQIAKGDSPEQFARHCSDIILGIVDVAETARNNRTILESEFSSSAITRRLLEDFRT